MTLPRDLDPGIGPEAAALLDTVVVPRVRDLGGFEVRRVLPSVRRKMVGPFVFLDQMGPAIFQDGSGLDVRPHPHIGLATVTYLLDGEILHRDSLGTVQPIRPGEVNWMTAGRGIAHSERTAPELRPKGGRLYGLQSWVALPARHEETDPAFAYHPTSDLPFIEGEGWTARLVAGSLFGARSPVATLWETLYADLDLGPGAVVPIPADLDERAVYLIEGAVEMAGTRFEPGQLLVLKPGEPIDLRAPAGARLILLGGEPMDGPRHIWWNFVSSSKDRIESAKADWKAGRFDLVPDETEFIPLPED
jgi:redox-sensitive bicupin YhaK (pirin superfamily)